MLGEEDILEDILADPEIIAELARVEKKIRAPKRDSKSEAMGSSKWPDEYDVVVAIERLEDLVHEGWEIRCSSKHHPRPRLNDGTPVLPDHRLRGAAAIAYDVNACTLPFVKWDDVDIDETGVAAKEEKKVNPPKVEIADEIGSSGPPAAAAAAAAKANVFEETSLTDELTKRYSTIFVAVLGLYNKGKTYVLNHLAGTILPHGSAYHTQGICMKTPDHEKKSKITFIDTAGFDFPVKVVVKGDENSVQRKKMVDQFIEDVALRLATVSIVVMNDITLYDQIYLETVRDTLQRYRKESMNAPELPQSSDSAGKYAELIVVHNFALSEDLAECRKAFVEQVTEKYPGDWRDQSLLGTNTIYRYWYTKEEQGRKVGMRHVFLGRCTEPLRPAPRFGKLKNQDLPEHNARTFQVIESWLQTHANEVKFEPLGKIVSCANEILPKYLINPPNVKLAVKKNRDKSKSLAIHVATRELWNPDIYPTTTTEGKNPLLMTALTWRLPIREQHSTMPPMQMNAPNYDVISTRTTVVIILDRVIPIPQVDFDPISKVCTVNGKYVEQELYSKDGVLVEHRGRRLGEYTLTIDLTRHLSHNVALQMTSYTEDAQQNLLYLSFEKIRQKGFAEPSKGSLSSVLLGQ